MTMELALNHFPITQKAENLMLGLKIHFLRN